MQKRPSDMTIRVWRVIFGLILISTLYYNLIIQWDSIETSFLFMNIENNVEYVKYALVALWIIPVFMWSVKVCVLKKKYMRIVQIVFWIFLFYVSSIIVEGPSLDVDSLIAFMWILPLLAWITGKCIPSYCMKFAEKITKIRV